MKSDHYKITEQVYRNLYLVQNRAYWHACPFSYDPKQDLVLTYDFGVFKEVSKIEGHVAFLDHLVDADVMEKYNYETYDFFSKWHCDKDGHDIFEYKGIKVGNAFRMTIWSNITQYVRTVVNLLAVRKIEYESMFVGISDPYTKDILKLLAIKMETWEPQDVRTMTEYYFPILRWIDERIYPTDIKQAIKFILTRLFDKALSLIDYFDVKKNEKINIFIQPYYPTKKIVDQLKNDSNINLIFENYTWTEGPFKERRLPLCDADHRYKRLAVEMINIFQMTKSVCWYIEDYPVSEKIYPIIINRISESLAGCLSTLDKISIYFKKRKLKLMITISNIGLVNCLMLNYCHYNKVPTYLIINGLLTSSYLDEAKYATWINSYGESIKNNYFRGMDNIVCLGDPRMDNYIINYKPKNINVKIPTIGVGASGFSNIDLNSYVAVEFDYFYDLMTSFQILRTRGRDMNIVVKVRSNAYIKQYQDFLKEYFPDMTVRLYDGRTPVKDLLSQTDFYISIYSQTLFEASSMGIPVLYYKKDTQINHPPFDGKSELVTAVSLDDLIKKIELFYKKDEMYEVFKKRSVMEKYLGPLDGRNLQRNMDFIHSLMSEKPSVSN